MSKWEAASGGTVDGHAHVIPIEDLRAHVEDRTCWCRPRVERIAPEPGTDWQPERLLIVHQAADGRELVERHGLQ